MGYLPGLSSEDFAEDWYNAWIIMAMAYMAVALYTLMLALALFNSYFFLLKQGRWKQYALFLFYFFTICLCISRIVYSIWVIPANQ